MEVEHSLLYILKNKGPRKGSLGQHRRIKTFMVRKEPFTAWGLPQRTEQTFPTIKNLPHDLNTSSMK